MEDDGSWGGLMLIDELTVKRRAAKADLLAYILLPYWDTESITFALMTSVFPGQISDAFISRFLSSSIMRKWLSILYRFPRSGVLSYCRPSTQRQEPYKQKNKGKHYSRLLRSKGSQKSMEWLIESSEWGEREKKKPSTQTAITIENILTKWKWHKGSPTEAEKTHCQEIQYKKY